MNTTKRYHVTFYLMMQGMDKPDKRDLGYVDALSKDGAIRKVLKSKFYNCPEDWEFLAGCMTATEAVGNDVG